MNKQTIIGIAIAGALTIGSAVGYQVGRESSVQTVSRLETALEFSRQDQYKLHLDLIAHDNPYHWQLDCDALGSCGYRRWNDAGTGGEYVYLDELLLEK